MFFNFHIIKRILFSNLLFFLLQVQSSYSGPPFLTDDPEPVDLHHFEFYLSSQDLINLHSGSGTLPHFEMNYGPFKNMQLHLEAPIGYSYVGNKINYGIADIELGIKYRFVEETSSIPQIGTFPLIEVPTGNADKGLGNGKPQVYLPLWLQKSWGDWTSYGGAGFWYNPGNDNKNWVYAGWLLQNKLSDLLTFGGEIYYHTPRNTTEKQTVGFNLGGFIDLNEKNHIIYSVGHSIAGENVLTAYLGYLITI
ncbi:MAG: transporter [FCB group bacterium]|jgi:hypothetical protein